MGHGPTVGQPRWATCQGGAGNRAWEQRACVRPQPGHCSLPGCWVTQRGEGEPSGALQASCLDQ